MIFVPSESSNAYEVHTKIIHYFPPSSIFLKSSWALP
jgi:hypothetical protein